MASIELDDVVSAVGGVPVLDGISFSVEDGEFIGLIGPSGAGKTSVVRAIAGFDPVVRGRVLFDQNDVTLTPTREHDIGIVTQGDTLFSTHTVRSNLSFPLRARAFSRRETSKRVKAESRANRIDHILDRWPKTLSAGEQRLAHIARALVRVPQVFLMDEPMANLDPPTKKRLRQELVTIQRGYGVTTIYVANRADEMMTMPDRLVAIEAGCVVQTGTPDEVYSQPASRAIAELTGALGTLDVHVETDGNGYWLTAPSCRVRAWSPALARYVGQQATLGVRTDAVRVVEGGDITMSVGPRTYESNTPARELQSSAGHIATVDHQLTEGSDVTIALTSWHLFATSGGLICSGH